MVSMSTFGTFVNDTSLEKGDKFVWGGATKIITFSFPQKSRGGACERCNGRDEGVKCK